MDYELRGSMRNVMQARWYSTSTAPFEFQRILLSYTWQDLSNVAEDMQDTHAFSQVISEGHFGADDVDDVILLMQHLLGLMQYREVVLHLSKSLLQLEDSLTSSRRTVSVTAPDTLPPLPYTMSKLAICAKQVGLLLHTYADRLWSMVASHKSTIYEQATTRVLEDGSVKLLNKLLNEILEHR